MSDPGLLAAILHDPDDDLPRLVYADALEWDEPDRAEFIRVQCELARLEALGVAHCKSLVANPSRDVGEPDGHEQERINLRHRERELLDAPLDPNGLFSRRLPARIRWGPAMTSHSGCEFRRGFVESVTLPAADWLTHADAILAAHPVRRVTLTSRPEWRMEARAEVHDVTSWRDSQPRHIRGRSWVECEIGDRRFEMSELPDVRAGQDRDTWAATAMLGHLWPKITFTLPRAGLPEPTGDFIPASAVARQRSMYAGTSE